MLTFYIRLCVMLLSLEKTPIPIFTNWFISNCCGQKSVSCGTSSPEKINIQLTSIKYQNSLTATCGQKYLDNLKALIKIGIRKVNLVYIKLFSQFLFQIYRLCQYICQCLSRCLSLLFPSLSVFLQSFIFFCKAMKMSICCFASSIFTCKVVTYIFC